MSTQNGEDRTGHSATASTSESSHLIKLSTGKEIYLSVTSRISVNMCHFQCSLLSGKIFFWKDVISVLITISLQSKYYKDLC